MISRRVVMNCMNSRQVDMHCLLEKYRPKDLSELVYNTDVGRRLSKLEHIPNHMIFSGPAGCGKTLLTMLFLEHLYGEGVRNVRREYIPLDGDGEKVICQIYSRYHYEYTPHMLGIYDRVFLKYLYDTLDENCQNSRNFKVIVIRNVDDITPEGQEWIVKMCDTYSDRCRLLMTCENVDALDPRLISRTLAIGLRWPTNEQMKNILDEIIKKEKITVSDWGKEEILRSRDLAYCVSLLDALSMPVRQTSEGGGGGRVGAEARNGGDIPSQTPRVINCDETLSGMGGIYKKIADAIMRGTDVTVVEYIKPDLRTLYMEEYYTYTIINTLFTHFYRICCMSKDKSNVDEKILKLCTETRRYLGYLRECNKQYNVLEGYLISVYGIIHYTQTTD